jgi:hypothetical protein
MRSARRQVVTIGVGIKCADGIVLSSDTLITVQGSHKFYQTKFYPIDLLDNAGRICFIFSGEPDLMNMFRDKFLKEITSMEYAPTVQGTRDVIEKILQQMEHEIINSLDRGGGLSTLCAMAIDNSLVLLKTSETSVHEVNFYDYLGAGDSSLIRYLTPLFLFEPVSLKKATVIAAYFVAKAKAFVDGCGGETTLMQILPNGKLVDCSAVITDQSVLMSEFLLKMFICGLMESDRTEKQNKEAMKRFSDSLGRLFL